MSGATRFNRGKTSPEMGGDWKGGSPREQPCNAATGIAGWVGSRALPSSIGLPWRVALRAMGREPGKP